MQVYIEFIYRHWELSLAFIGVIIAFIITESRRTPGNGISPQHAVDLMNHQHAVVIDLRSYETYQSGHVVGAISMPVDELDSKLKKFTKNHKKPIVLVCATGQVSQKSIAKFIEQGFTNTLYISGGLQAWSADGLPITGE
jgi:rhodanese-related sulfurtransferase